MKTILITILFFALSMNAQVHLNSGYVSLDNLVEGNQLNFSFGYTEFITQNFGITASWRSTHALNGHFTSYDFLQRYRTENRGHRFELAGGVNLNSAHGKARPMIHIRNSFRIRQKVFISLDFDRIFDFGSYIMLGVTWDTNLFKQRIRPLKYKTKIF